MARMEREPDTAGERVEAFIQYLAAAAANGDPIVRAYLARVEAEHPGTIAEMLALPERLKAEAQASLAESESYACAKCGHEDDDHWCDMQNIGGGTDYCRVDGCDCRHWDMGMPPTPLDTGRWVDQSGEIEPGPAWVLWCPDEPDTDRHAYLRHAVLRRNVNAQGEESGPWEMTAYQGPVTVTADDYEAAARIIRHQETKT